MKRVSEDVFQQNLESALKAKQSKTGQDQDDPFVQVMKTARAEAKKELEELVNEICPPPPISEQDIEEASTQIVADLERICKENLDDDCVIEDILEYDNQLKLEYPNRDCKTIAPDWWSKVVTWSKKVRTEIAGRFEYDVTHQMACDLYTKYLNFCKDIIQKSWLHVHPSFPITFEEDGMLKIAFE